MKHRSAGQVLACKVLAAVLMASSLHGAATAAPQALDANSPSASSDEALAARRLAAYQRVKSLARTWLDQLEVDPVELMQHGVKGKKKVAEILDCYLHLFDVSTDATDRDAIHQRVADLAKQLARPEYHDLLQLSDDEFAQNSMSYLRVAWLLERFGLDTRAYREEILRAKPRLDLHLPRRGPWQRAVFLEYYEFFGLEQPPNLAPTPLEDGVIARRVPVEQYNEAAIYNLTHEVFVAFEYGRRRNPTRLSALDLDYARETCNELMLRCIDQKHSDLVGELLACATYLGGRDGGACRQAVGYLLDRQNANGTWGEYEKYRPEFGKYLEQHVYLHTTLVVLQGLIAMFEEDWKPRVDEPAQEADER